MKYPFENLKENKNFWSFFISTSFPLSYDETLDLDLQSFVDENYEDISNEVYKWSNEFTQYHDDVINECDGYIDNPTYIEINLNEKSLKIEYHPGGTLYFLDSNEIADLYYQIKKISYEKFKNLTINLDDTIRVLLLPILYMDKPNWDIENLIHKILEKTYFNLKDFDTIYKLVISHIQDN